MRVELAARFAATSSAPSLFLPPALRESIVAAGLLEGRLPANLTEHYTVRLPTERAEQIDVRATDAGRALLGRRLELSRLPRLRTALEGLHAALTEAGVDPSVLLGVPSTSPERLIAARPTLAALYAPTLFASGVPLLGAYRSELAMFTDELAAGRDADALLDLRLSGHIIHELCHGLSYETAGPPPPWMIVEAGVVELCRVAREGHVLPSEPGEAVAGTALFALLGGALARLFGRGALWRILAEPRAFTAAFGPRAAAVLEIAGYQDWLRRREPPFARDALEAIAWVKLADATFTPPRTFPDLDRAAELPPLTAARALPDLLLAVREVPWFDLPWWAETADTRDDELVATAVRSVFAVHRLTRVFETIPDEVPERRLLLDVESCELAALPRPDGIFVEPARALFPPPLARSLHARGARRITLEGVLRSDARAVIAALCELAAGTRALDAEPQLRFG